MQGEGAWVGAERVLRDIHRRLYLPEWLGVPIVAALSLLVTTNLLTALVVYKRWWRGFTRRPRRGDARAWWGDLHRLLGVWSLGFLVLLSATGLWYLVESLGGGAPPLPQAKQVAAALGPAKLGARLAPALAAAHARAPDLVVERIFMPTDDDGSFLIQGQRSASLVRARANVVAVAAATGTVTLVTDARALGLHQRIGEAADPLHFGTFGGYWTKILWVACGLMATSLALSGTAVHALRIGRANGLRRIDRAALATAWRGMGPLKWAAVAGIATALGLLIAAPDHIAL